MIIGDYYVNNFLVAGVFLVLLAAVGFFVAVPGFSDGGSQPEDDPVDDFDVKFNDSGTDDFDPGTSHTVNFVDDEGGPVSGADVTVNDREVGVTDDEGQVSFEIPQESTVTVTAEVKEGDVSRRYEFEDGSIISSEKVDEGSDSGDSSGEGSGSGDDSGDSDGSDGGSEDSSGESDEDDGSGDGSSDGSDDGSGSGDDSGEDSGTGDSDGGSGEDSGDNSDQSDEDGSQEGDNGDSSGDGSDDEEGSGGGDGSDGSEQSGEELEAILGSSEYTLIRGERFTFNASNSTGDISYFYWQFGDGSTAIKDNPLVTNTFYDSGDYVIDLVAVGENGGQSYTNATLDVLPEPVPQITMENPSNEMITNKTFLDYEVSFENVSEKTNYSIRINGNEKVSGNLDGGSDSIQRIVDNPPNIFNTSVQVVQDREIFNSEKFTVNATAAPPDPMSKFKYPKNGYSIGIDPSSTSITFEYELENSTWAEKAEFSVYNESETLLEKTVSTSPGNYSEEVPEMFKGRYNYSLTFGEDEKSVTESNTFKITDNQVGYPLSVNEPENKTEIGNESGEPQNVTFNISYNTNFDGMFRLEADSSQQAENDYKIDGEEFNITYEEGENVLNKSIEIQEGTGLITFDKQFNVSNVYEWEAWFEVDGLRKGHPLDPRQFNVTEEP